MARRAIQRDPKTGVYYVQIQREGVRRHFPLGPALKDAKRELKRIERDIAAGTIEFTKQETTATLHTNGRRDILLSELVIRHLEWVKHYRSEGTYKHRHRFAYQLLEFLKLGEWKNKKFEITGNMMVSEITRATLTDFHLWARSKRKHPNSGNHALRNAKTLLLWGVEEELCDLSFRKFPPIREVLPETKRVDLASLAALFEKAPQDLCDIVKFGLLTGLRPQELRDLRVNQIIRPEDDRWYIRIEHHKTAGRTKERFPRSVPLSDEAREIVARQLASHPKSKFVFVNDDGGPYERTALRNRLIRWCRRAKVPDITPYALRHTFASIESDNHVESTALAKLMGHSTTAMLGRYVSNSREHDVDAVQKAESALKKALSRAPQQEKREAESQNERAKNYCKTTFQNDDEAPDSAQVVE